MPCGLPWERFQKPNSCYQNVAKTLHYLSTDHSIADPLYRSRSVPCDRLSFTGSSGTRIISILKKDAGISEITLNLRELDLDGADLGPLRLGSSRNPAVVVRSIHVDYSPGELYQRKVKKIMASGMEIHAEFKNGTPGLCGFDLAELFNRLKSLAPRHSASGDHPLPFFPQRIQIKGATLLCEITGQVYRIPFEIVTVKEAGTAPILNVLIDMYPRGGRRLKFQPVWI